MNWEKKKKIAKWITRIFILFVVLQTFFIFKGYIDRNWGNDDFWELKEEYKWDHLTEEKPEQLSIQERNFTLLRLNYIFVLIGAIFFEYTRYKSSPKIYLYKMKKNWLGRIYLKIYDIMKVKEGENENGGI